MKPLAFVLIVAFFAAGCRPAAAQSFSSPAAAGAMATAPAMPGPALAPFSRIAFGAGFSPLGINLMAATNLNRYANLRVTGNVLKFTENNISTNGFDVDADLSLASAGLSLDVYPFPAHGLRFSPGLLFYNANNATALFTVQAGTSFSLNDYTYYASASAPVKGNGHVGLNSTNPAFTITAGWGNQVPRNGRHWSYPVEIGVALVGAPSLDIALTSGQVCDANGQNCVNVATDPSVQSNLRAQVASYKGDLEPLKTYPIVSVGVAYSFNIRH